MLAGLRMYRLMRFLSSLRFNGPVARNFNCAGKLARESNQIYDTSVTLLVHFELWKLR